MTSRILERVHAIHIVFRDRLIKVEIYRRWSDRLLALRAKKHDLLQAYTQAIQPLYQNFHFPPLCQLTGVGAIFIINWEINCNCYCQLKYQITLAPYYHKHKHIWYCQYTACLHNAIAEYQLHIGWHHSSISVNLLCHVYFTVSG